MDKIYLPEKLVIGQEEKDLYPYDERKSTSFCVSFTLNEPTQMNTGNRYKDNLDACLTAVSWVEDNYCSFKTRGISINEPNYERLIKTITIYMDRGGYLVSGLYQELKYNAFADDTGIPKKITTLRNFKRKFISKSTDNLLHKEIFMDKIFRIKDIPEFKINTQSDFYKLLQTVSIYNRSMDMSFVYSIAQEKKAQLDAFKKIVGIVSIPIAIEGYAWVKALQAGISLINYLCTVDDVMKLTDKLFEFRGPVIISDVFENVYVNESNRYYEFKGKPQKINTGTDLRRDDLKKLEALRNFMEVKTELGGKIKIIKEPITEIK